MFDFASGTDRISYGAASIINNLTAMTVSALVSIDSYTDGTYARIYAKGSPKAVGVTNTTHARSFWASIGYPSGVYMESYAATNSLPAAPTENIALAWRWLGGATRSTDLKLYYAGSEAAYAGGTNGAGSPLSDDANDATIGNNAASTQGFNGRIAELAVWNVALSEAEIASLAKGFKPHRIRPQSLVLYLPLIRDANDRRSALSPTTTGTTVANHPRVY